MIFRKILGFFAKGLHLYLQTDVGSLLRKSIKVHTESAVREAIYLARIAKNIKKLNKVKRMKDESLQYSFYLTMDISVLYLVLAKSFNLFVIIKH